MLTSSTTPWYILQFPALEILSLASILPTQAMRLDTRRVDLVPNSLFVLRGQEVKSLTAILTRSYLAQKYSAREEDCPRTHAEQS